MGVPRGSVIGSRADRPAAGLPAAHADGGAEEQPASSRRRSPRCMPPTATTSSIDTRLTIDKMIQFVGVVRKSQRGRHPHLPGRGHTGRTSVAVDVLIWHKNSQNMQAILNIFRGLAPLADAPEQQFEDTTTTSTLPHTTTSSATAATAPRDDVAPATQPATTDTAPQSNDTALRRSCRTRPPSAEVTRPSTTTLISVRARTPTLRRPAMGRRPSSIRAPHSLREADCFGAVLFGRDDHQLADSSCGAAARRHRPSHGSRSAGSRSCEPPCSRFSCSPAARSAPARSVVPWPRSDNSR